METTNLWEASSTRKNASHMAQYYAYLKSQHKLEFNDYQALHAWSINNINLFWQTISEFTGIRWHTRPSTFYSPPAKNEILGSQWCMHGSLNFAENLLPNPSEKIVLQSYYEGRDGIKTLTAKQLNNAVGSCVAFFRQLGLKKGDRVCAVTANTAEAIIAMLAASALGCIWSSCSPDFGAAGIIDRFKQIEPSVLLFTARYQYAGKLYDCVPTIEKCLPELPHLKAVVAVDHLAAALPPLAVSFKNVAWQEIMALTPEAPIKFTPVSYDDPLYIMFSSGTTGIPKCIVHGAIGTLMQHKKELLLHSDIGSESNLLFFTTCGWMMWNWMVSALSVGASLTLFEGALTYPNLGILWQVVEDAKVTALGTSPKYISLCMKENYRPRSQVALKNLRSILSTGSPLLKEHYYWIYDNVKSDAHLASISGGTDIISCFMLGNPLLPVVAGEIQCLGLGMAVAAWDETGQPLVGEKGELVCTKPFISMPLGFWGDPSRTKYLKTYFAKYTPPLPQVWWHGDFIEITPAGSVIVYGRSDTTLNPGGVRIGSAEIYRQVEGLAEVSDCLVIGHTYNNDVRILLFVKLASGVEWDDQLARKIKARIRTNLTPRHVPGKIFPVEEIPYTKSGKKVEQAVTNIFNGIKVANVGALQNPGSLASYQRLAQEET